MPNQHKENKKPKVSAQYYCINVKISSEPKPTPTDYVELFLKVFRDDIAIKYRGENAIALRTQFPKTLVLREREYQIIYGKILRFTLIEGDNWYIRGKRDFADVEIPKDSFPNPKETDYIFIPSIHRFLLKKGLLNVNHVALFLEKALNLVVEKNKSVSAQVQSSADVIEKILQSDAVLSLDVNVTYTNDDIGAEAKELMDSLLKEGNIQEMEAKLRPDQTEEINTNSKLVRGFLELAMDNGSATASVRNNGRREKIVTTSHPSITPMSAEDDQLLTEEIAKLMIGKYPRNKDEKN